MSLDTAHNKILAPFIHETLNSIQSMAHLKSHSDDGFIDDVDKFRFKGYAICAKTNGTINGAIIMHHYIETAVALGNTIRHNVLQDEETFDDINDPMADALAEWGNTIIGRAMKSFSAKDLGIHFEPPYFVFDTETMQSLLQGINQIFTVPVHVDGIGRFYFNYLVSSIDADIHKKLDEITAEDIKDESAIILNVNPSNPPLETHKKILLVDDMKMVRTSMKKYLGKMGYENIIEANNGREAVEKAYKEKPDFIFMDVVMPEMQGNEALNYIRSENPHVPVVMLSSVADQKIIDECQEVGISGYIIKPLTSDNGPETLKKFLYH